MQNGSPLQSDCCLVFVEGFRAQISVCAFVILGKGCTSQKGGLFLWKAVESSERCYRVARASRKYCQLGRGGAFRHRSGMRSVFCWLPRRWKRRAILSRSYGTNPHGTLDGRKTPYGILPSLPLEECYEAFTGSPLGDRIQMLGYPLNPWSPVSNALRAENGTRLPWMSRPGAGRAMWKTARSAASPTSCEWSTTPRRRSSLLLPSWNRRWSCDAESHPTPRSEALVVDSARRYSYVFGEGLEICRIEKG